MKKKLDLNKLLTVVMVVMVTLAVVSTAVWYSVTKNSDTAPPVNPNYNPGSNNVGYNSNDDYYKNNGGGMSVDDMLSGQFGEEEVIGEGQIIESAELWYAMGEAKEPVLSKNVNNLYSKIIKDINKKASEQNSSSRGNSSSNQQDHDKALSAALEDMLNNIGKDGPQIPDYLQNDKGSGNTKGEDYTGGEGGYEGEIPTSPESPDVDLIIESELNDEKGKISTGKFNLYDHVSKDTPIVSGGSLTDKVFGELDRLSNKFVVVVNKDTSIESVINAVVNNYKNKLLIDKIHYGRVSEKDNRHFLFEIEYLVTEKQMEELKKYATGIAEKAKDRKGKKQIEYIAQVISDLGSYDENGTNIYSPYSLYKDRKGVCQAYTSLAKIILDTLGIENGIVTGSLDGVPHTWNIAKYDGEWYHFDFTLTDTKRDKSKYLFIKSSDITNDKRVVDNIIR